MNQRYLKSMLDRYGNTVSISRGGRREVVRAFIQPLRRRRRLYIRDKKVPLGYFGDDYYLYIGDGAHGLSGGEVLTFKGRAYTVLSADEFFVRDSAAYSWAILRPKNDVREDDYDVIDG